MFSVKFWSSWIFAMIYMRLFADEENRSQYIRVEVLDWLNPIWMHALLHKPSNKSFHMVHTEDSLEKTTHFFKNQRCFWTKHVRYNSEIKGNDRSIWFRNWKINMDVSAGICSKLYSLERITKSPPESQGNRNYFLKKKKIR